MNARDQQIPDSATSWTFLTNHSHVLLCLVAEPDVRLRDVAERVGITERAVQRIVKELEEADVLVRVRRGRRNQYEVRLDQPLRHPIESHCSVRDLVRMVLATRSSATGRHPAQSNA